MQWAEFGSSVRHLSDGDREVVRRAFDLGERAHRHQKRQSGEQYFSHPIAVARILADLGGDKETIVAGLLHDTVEDTDVSLQDIVRDFGPGVAKLIDGVTKLERFDVADNPHLDEQIETLRKMFTLMQQDIRIMVIKLADRLHNMQTIGYVPIEKQMRIARETTDVYAKIADRLCMRDLKDDLESLSLSVLEPELHARLQELRRAKESTGQKVMQIVSLQLSKTHHATFSSVAIRYEHKSWARLRELLKAQGAHITGLASVSVSFVCESIDQCYSVMGALHQEWQREILSFQDFINSPMINGYQALHTTIILGDGTRVRCKIRTKEMEEYAHRGVTISCFDSKMRGLPDYLPWTKRIATISSDTSNESGEFWEGLQSDILGATIVVHGPDDNTVLLPRDATALDGAFYLFGEHALRTKELRMNGRILGFDEPLENASSLFATFAPEPQVSLRWLHMVHTAVASAIIRTQLSTAPEQEKLAVGRELLDIALQRVAHLKLGEVSSTVLEKHLPEFGVGTFDELLERIAEGKQDAVQVAMSLFIQKGRRSGFSASTWMLHAEVPHQFEEQIFKIAKGYPNARIVFSHSLHTSNFKIRFRLTQSQLQELETILRALLPEKAWSLRGVGTNRALILIGGTIVTLWGLDPVCARWLLLQNISPYDLTFLRAVVFFLASGLLYAAQFLLFGRRLKWLSPFNPTLMLTGAALFVTALFTYISLQHIAATEYILLIVAGLLVTVLLHQMLHRERWHRTAVSLLLLGAALFSVGYAFYYNMLALFAATGSALGFSLYTELSRRYQQTEAPIRARYPAFLFWLSCVGFALSGFVLPLTNFDILPARDVGLTVVYVLVFSVLPYSLYFEITRRMDSSILDRSSPFVVVVALAGELAVFSSMKPLLALPFVLIFLWHYYASLRKEGHAANILWRPSNASPQ